MSPLMITIIAGIFGVIATVISSTMIIRNSHNNASEDFKMTVAQEIATLKTKVDSVDDNSNHNNTCDFHQNSFDRVHDRIDGVETGVEKELKEFGRIVASLDKNVAVFTQQLTAIVSRNAEIEVNFKEHKKIYFAHEMKHHRG